MGTPEKKAIRNVEKGKLKQKFARLTNDYHLLDESENELRLGRIQANLAKTQEDLYQIQSPDAWFSDWGIFGGEKTCIEINQSKANRKKQEHLKGPAFLH